MSHTSQPVLLIFIKNPEQGHVKTRLAKTIGKKQALKVYKKLLTITKSVTDQVNCHRQLWYSQFIDKQDLWPNQAYDKHLQKGVDLGERMKNAFCKAFAANFNKAVIVGSDCPDLTPVLIHEAFDALDEHDIVVGPSKDGGYYLLGMASLHTQIFDLPAWSTSNVCDQTIEQAEKLELTYRLLSTLNDIDTEEDLIRSHRIAGFS